jgi:uncharacterized protein
MAKNVLIAGASGLVGTRLTELLEIKGYKVISLSRKEDISKGIYGWNPEAGTINEEAVRKADVVINLAGTGIADGRWTLARKKSIIESRVQGAAVLKAAFLRTGKSPECYLSASASGFYGNSGEREMTESDVPVDDTFKVQTCVLWEKAAQEVADLGIRTVIIRIGIVLATHGGALKEIMQPMRLGLGAYFADGKAWYAWIHRDDLCRMFIWAIENQGVSGIYNGATPNNIRNIDLVKATAKAMNKRAVFLPAPALVLRTIFGEMADIILDSTKMSVEKLEKAGFIWSFPKLEDALKDLTNPIPPD